MIKHPLSVDLPQPWVGNKFITNHIGSINFLVGPNGSGKSQFARTLKSCLPQSRMLGTDRLSMMVPPGIPAFGDNFQQGFRKDAFHYITQAGESQTGDGIDTFIILEQRLDLRIRVEATLSHLFNRAISLEWDSGMLVPRAVLGGGNLSYRLDRDECHGIRELLVLLTHLYNDRYKYLIIDEPELHLHPQYQAFFVNEVRKVAGDPSHDPAKKILFLVTHSPFILDLRSFDDVQSIISFDLQRAVPRHIHEIDPKIVERISKLTPRLNVEHRQLFFSDNPIFVEGPFDAQIVSAIQECRGESIAASGSCVIASGGNEEVNKFFELCQAFGKRAFFLYDLDSLFTGTLRSCLRADETVSDFLAKLGLGNNFAKYCGQLDKALGAAIGKIRQADPTPSSLETLRSYLDKLGDSKPLSGDNLARGRLAVLVQASRDQTAFVDVLKKADIDEIKGFRDKIVEALATKNILLLPGGALEHYLPSYTGNPFAISEDAKRAPVEAEMTLMAQGMSAQQLESRYRDLYHAITKLPTKSPVDLLKALNEYLSNYVHNFQGLVIKHPDWDLSTFHTHFAGSSDAVGRLFKLVTYSRQSDGKFVATIEVPAAISGKAYQLQVSESTNAGMRSLGPLSPIC